MMRLRSSLLWVEVSFFAIVGRNFFLRYCGSEFLSSLLWVGISFFTEAPSLKISIVAEEESLPVEDFYRDLSVSQRKDLSVTKKVLPSL